MNQSKPLTKSQLLLWTGQQLHPNVPLYNMIFTFELAGKIEVEIFREAFRLLVQGSDAMRTVFEVVKGVPQQKVLPELPYEMEVVDWSAGADFEVWLAERNSRMFDLMRCLFDSVLIRFSEEKYVWYSSQHHLISDAWSASVLYRNMAEIYGHLLNKTQNEIPEITLFNDYLNYEKESSKKNNSATQFWQQKSQSLPQMPRLYGTSKSKKNISPTQSERIICDLGLERSTRLRALTHEVDIRAWTEHLSLFNIFTTVLFAWLHRVSGQSELAISTPAHNRATAAFKNMPGVCIELFPLINIIEKNDTFKTLFQRVSVNSLEFLKYAQSGMVSPELNRGINVVLNYIHATFEDFNGIPVITNWLYPNHADAIHHLRLQVVSFDGTGNIQLYFDINEAVFDVTLQKRIEGHFLKLLDAFIADRTQSIFQASLLSEKEYQEIIIGLNSKGNEASNTSKVSDIAQISVLQLFENQAKNNPENIAIFYKKENYTYRDFNKKTDQLAHYLQSKNITSGSRVAIYTKRSLDLLVSIFAVWKCGATYIPIATDYPAERVRYILEDAQADLLIAHRNLAVELTTQTPILNLDNERENIRQNPVTTLAVHSTSPAYIIYTSGSTGKPKGVVISHESLSNYLQWAKSEYVTIPNPMMPLFTSISFDLTITSLFLPLISNGQSIIYEENETGADLALLDVIEENKVDIIKLTPSHLALLKGKNYENSLITTMIVGGEDFKTDLANSIQNSFSSELKIYNEYGPTEATVGCTAQQFNPKNTTQTSVPIGSPIANMQTFILDDFGYPVPQGVVGELYVAGAGLAKKYWEREGLTKEKFTKKYPTLAPRMYRTGDLARLNERGQLEYLGRVDQQVKISGRRIELGEIEAALNTYMLIENCVVTLQAARNETLDPQLAAFYTGTKTAANLLRDHLARQLPEYMLPTYFAYMDALPITQNGKIDHAALPILDNTVSEQIYVAPSNEFEEILHELWSEVLEIEQIGVHDRFLNIGGNSLAALRLVTRIEEAFDLKITVNKVFEYTTIAELGRHIEEVILEILEQESQA